MIRPTDLTSAANWAQATNASSWRVGTPAANSTASATSTWFDGDAIENSAPISADLSAASRGLSVDQHAARVLLHLRGEPDNNT